MTIHRLMLSAGLAALMLAACGKGEAPAPSPEPETPAVSEPVDDPTPLTGRTPTATLPSADPCGPVTAAGYCGVTFGMSAEDAMAAFPGGLASGLEDFPDDPDVQACYYLILSPENYEIGFMVVDGIVQRLDVNAPGVATEAGASVGMMPDEVLALYPDATTEPNPYTGDDDIIAALDGEAKAIFELDYEGHMIGRYRIGVPPAVDYIEGCS